MEITKINLLNIESTIAQIESNKFMCSKLAHAFKGNIEYSKIDENKNKYIIRNHSEIINVIIIDCTSDKVDAITFYGELDITCKELNELFGDSRKVYVPHDEAENIFFNENRNKGNYFIKFFIEGFGNKNSDWEYEKLQNLSIYFS